MTKEEWKQVEAALGWPYGTAKLHIDGFEVALGLARAAPLKYVITSYINGHFKGDWLITDCEERRRFLRPVTLHLYTPKKRAELLKRFGKRRLKEWGIDLDRTSTCYRWDWTSFAALRRHLVANNERIELITADIAGALL